MNGLHEAQISALLRIIDTYMFFLNNDEMRRSFYATAATFVSVTSNSCAGLTAAF
jgi:hypothetical protein